MSSLRNGLERRKPKDGINDEEACEAQGTHASGNRYDVLSFLRNPT